MLWALVLVELAMDLIVLDSSHYWIGTCFGSYFIVDSRNIRWALIISPVVFGVIITFGVMVDEWVYFTCVGGSLVIGIGSDDGLHVVHRMREEPRCLQMSLQLVLEPLL